MSHPFYEKVYAITRAIPAGKVLNYGAVADLLDHPRAARAVGYALNALQGQSDVPWHRVVGKQGSFGTSTIRNFVFAREEQIALLADEGIQFDENRRFPLLDYLWQPSPAEVAAILREAGFSPAQD